MELYRVESLTFTYPGQFAPALRDVSLTLCAGEFVTLCGLSGSGKSTLLRQLKTALAPNGVRSGAVLFDGRPLSDVSQREQAERIGFVQQSPENQIVTDKVWHELAFGPESLGYDTPTIRRRVAEMAGFFGMESWFHREAAALSGGQKQLLNLAAVLTLQPDVLILDEPTAQLDPIAAADFLAALARVNRELGTTVLLSEQRLEEAVPLADHLIVLEQGRLLAAGAPQDFHFLRGIGILDQNLEEKAVKLGFRQGISAFMLQRILRGVHDKGLRKRPRLSGHGDLLFLHGFQQGRLGLGGSAVNFVRQQQVREYRTRHILERPAAVCGSLQNLAAQNIRRHQVRRKLDALEIQPQNPAQRADEQGLRQTGNAHDQAMPAAQKRDEHLIHHILLPHDHLGGFFPDGCHNGTDTLPVRGNGFLFFSIYHKIVGRNLHQILIIISPASIP